MISVFHSWVSVLVLACSAYSVYQRPIQFGQYLKLRTLGGGASAVAYEVRRNGKKYALKKAKYTGNVLKREFEILRELDGIRGFPKAFEFFKCSDGTDCYVMQLVGPVLAEVQKSRLGSLRELPVYTVGSLAIQMIDRIETMHKRGLVHSDFYRNNISPGVGPEVTLLYAIDFGQVCRFTRGEKCKSKVFDIRSIGFSILGMLQKSVKYGDYQHFSEDRNKPSLKSLVSGLPKEIFDLMKYIFSLTKDEQRINYEYMRVILSRMITNTGHKYNGSIIWPNAIVAKLP